jgi:hypothetical protein
VPCAQPIASSTKTSKYCNFVRRRREDRGTLETGSTVGETGGPEASGKGPLAAGGAVGQGTSGKGALGAGGTVLDSGRQGLNGKAHGSRIGDSVSAEDAVRRGC